MQMIDVDVSVVLLESERSLIQLSIRSIYVFR